jgi:hypothetical protein
MPSDGRTPEQLRNEIETEREQLARAVEELRTEMSGGLSAKLQAKLPVVAVSALGAGFVLAGGIGATMRLVFRRGREGTERARLGRFTIIDRS